MEEETIKAYIEGQVNRFEYMGHPALLERFILRNGHEGKAQRRPKGMRKRAYRECFSNSTQLVWGDSSLTYVEGMAVSMTLGMLMHHAWAEDPDGNVIDLTWKDPTTCLYYGVSFTRTIMDEQLLKNKVYGLLDTGMGLNADLMFQMDPALKDVVDDISSKRLARKSPIFRWESAQ